jgi:hypothetical protein
LGITKKSRRKFPFFKLEYTLNLERLDSPNSLHQITLGLTEFFQPEIADVLYFKGTQQIRNLRGRPTVANGIETGQEVLLKFQGTYLEKLQEEQVPFTATLETKFKEFKNGAIIYTLFQRLPAELEKQNISEIISLKEVTVEQIEIGMDFFENKTFPLLGIKLQELTERIAVNFSLNQSASGSQLEGLIISNNLQLPKGFSDRLQSKISSLSKAAALPALVSEISY